MPEQKSDLKYYKPLRCLTISIILSALPFVILWEIIGISLEDILLFMSQVLDKINQNWVARFCERLINQPFKLFLLWMGFTVIIYSLSQSLGLIQDSKYYHSIFYKSRPRRIKMVARFLYRISGRSKIKNTPMKNFREIVRDLEDHIEFGENALMSPLRFCLSAFPMLGFIGTVVGLSGAIRHLPKAMQSGGDLDSVLENLYVAFDTTFLGLTGALLTLILIKIVEHQWDNLARVLEHNKEFETNES